MYGRYRIKRLCMGGTGLKDFCMGGTGLKDFVWKVQD